MYRFKRAIIMICIPRDRLFCTLLLVTSLVLLYQGRFITTTFSSVSICQGTDAINCPRPLRDFPSKYRTALPSFPITACVIEKSMSTFLAAIMCYLHDPESFRKSNRALHTEMYHSRFCAGKNEFASFKAASKKKAQLITVVRDPLERFISGYVDKCLVEKVNKMDGLHCYGCSPGDIVCFMKVQYERVLAYSKGELSAVRRSYYDVHFFPQNWYCGFSNAFSNYTIIRYGSSGDTQRLMAEDISDALRRGKVNEEHIEYIMSSLLSSRTNHSTSDSPEKDKLRDTIVHSEYLIAMITRMFYHDYILFGFEFPVYIAATTPPPVQVNIRADTYN